MWAIKSMKISKYRENLMKPWVCTRVVSPWVQWQVWWWISGQVHETFHQWCSTDLSTSTEHTHPPPHVHIVWHHMYCHVIHCVCVSYTMYTTIYIHNVICNTNIQFNTYTLYTIDVIQRASLTFVYIDSDTF